MIIEENVDDRKSSRLYHFVSNESYKREISLYFQARN